jgi:hypothetical protein
MNKTMFSPHLLLFSHVSTLFVLFTLFSCILEYLRAAVDLVWICFLSLHLCFPEFLISCQFLKILKNKVSQKIPENSFKNFMSKMGQRGTWDTSGRPTMPPHHMVAWPGPGRAMAWCGAPWPSTLTSPPSSSLSLLKYLHSIAQTRVLAILTCDFRSPCLAHLCC